MNDLYKNYDEKEHAKCLLKILEKNNPCSHCQLGYANDYNLWKIDSYSECELIPFYVHCCSICHVFINMDKITGEEFAIDKCPCYVLGKAEAIKRTWIALEEKGYI